MARVSRVHFNATLGFIWRDAVADGAEFVTNFVCPVPFNLYWTDDDVVQTEFGTTSTTAYGHYAATIPIFTLETLEKVINNANRPEITVPLYGPTLKFLRRAQFIEKIELRHAPLGGIDGSYDHLWQLSQLGFNLFPRLKSVVIRAKATEHYLFLSPDDSTPAARLWQCIMTSGTISQVCISYPPDRLAYPRCDFIRFNMPVSASRVHIAGVRHEAIPGVLGAHHHVTLRPWYPWTPTFLGGPMDEAPVRNAMFLELIGGTMFRSMGSFNFATEPGSIALDTPVEINAFKSQPGLAQSLVNDMALFTRPSAVTAFINARVRGMDWHEMRICDCCGEWIPMDLEVDTRAEEADFLDEKKAAEAAEAARVKAEEEEAARMERVRQAALEAAAAADASGDWIGSDADADGETEDEA